MEYKLIFKKNYPLIEIDNKLFFIDLGQNECICRAGRISFMGKNFPCDVSLPFRDLDFVSSDLEAPIYGMLGRSILCNYYLRFDYKHATIEVSETPFNVDGCEEIDLKIENGIFVKGSINGKEGKILVDSGFKIVYVTDESLLKGEIVRHIKDCTSLGTPFEKDTRNLNIQIGCIRYIEDGADFPDEDNEKAKFKDGLGIIGAVGFGFLSQAEMIMDFRQNKIFVR